jgi:enoyl-CoA hydratase
MQLQTDKMLAEKDGSIGWMIFNNPDRRNAVSLEMWQAVDAILEEFDQDDEIRVVVVRGAGDKAFVSGADISEFEKQRSDAEAAEAYGRISGAARARLGSLRKPVIAMIRGFCLGGGLAVAMKTDVRIASEDAQFGIPAARLGVSYAFESVQALTHLVGPAFAKEILYTGRRFMAEEALRIGLINRVTSIDELESVVRDYASTIAGNAPLTIRSAKLVIGEICKDPERRDMAAVETAHRACFDSQDYAEGRRAFMEKRKPAFVGR